VGLRQRLQGKPYWQVITPATHRTIGGAQPLGRSSAGVPKAAGDSGTHDTIMAARFAVNQVGKALGSAYGAAVTAFAGACGGFAVIGVGLLAVAMVYTLHLLLKRTIWRTQQDPGDFDAVAPAAHDG